MGGLLDAAAAVDRSRDLAVGEGVHDGGRSVVLGSTSTSTSTSTLDIFQLLPRHRLQPGRRHPLISCPSLRGPLASPGGEGILTGGIVNEQMPERASPNRRVSARNWWHLAHSILLCGDVRTLFRSIECALHYERTSFGKTQANIMIGLLALFLHRCFSPLVMLPKVRCSYLTFEGLRLYRPRSAELSHLGHAIIPTALVSGT